ncbi:LysR family transcriptional regulator [Methylobacterium sp. NEAU 140]|uniref:LysR family transcriptional regulator n=1 Tax=Methylobacterium sp. NEAU 140 TaxID=3064945 RepID=UPI0027340BF8|nr:LysR family transcriptional regulator [Methylobacterium sp. NEAU 140]MDP4021264.1 LysR family transcriptional regulator [Methylobacterium sp. NEAU 140]
MSLRALRTLHAIVRHGSFARAGEAVGLTQSAVSLQVKGLEDEFGAALFDRSRRLPRLTAAGTIVVERSRDVLALYDGIAAALGDEQALAGRLRLGAVQTALSGVLPEALAALSRSHPRVRVHVSAGLSVQLALRLAAGELDAAVTTEPVRPHPPDLTWTPLYEDRFWLLAPPGHGGEQPRALLTELPFIRFDSQTWAGRVIDRELRRMRLEVREEMVLDSLEAIVRMVERGLGVAIVPLSDDSLAGLRLTARPFGDPHLFRRIVLLERSDRSGGRLAAALAEAVTTIKAGRVAPPDPGR